MNFTISIKMLNNSLKIVTFFLTSFLFLACSDDNLELLPLNEVSENTFFKTESGATLAVNACYDALQPNGFHRNLVWTEQISDNARSQRGGIKELGQCRAVATNRVAKEFWIACYTGVARCNRAIDNIELMEVLDGDVKSRLIAEAVFLRALYYHYLTWLYGDVPLITRVLANDELLVPRNTRQEIIDQITSDLESILPNLPSTYGSSDMGRVTQGAAMAFLAREYLFNKNWGQAAKWAKQTIDLGVYSLNDDYAAQFSSVDAENSPESIFEIQFMAFSREGSSINNYNAPAGMGLTHNGGYNYIQPMQNLVDEYEAKSKALIDTGFSAKDPRLDFSILGPGSEILGVTYTPEVSETGYNNRKYIVGKEGTGPDDSGLNFIMMRYAEVLLIYAEALIESNQNLDEAAKYMDRVRQRPSVNMPAIVVENQEQMREALRHERRVEFAMEGNRYFDLLRWRIAKEAIEKKGKEKSEGYDIVFDENKHYLWPIPQEEMDRNPNLATNNPGY